LKFAANHYCKYMLLQPALGGSSYNFICTLLNEYKSCINHCSFCTLKHYIVWDTSPLAPFKGRLPVVGISLTLHRQFPEFLSNHKQLIFVVTCLEGDGLHIWHCHMV
jgi:hypothetical protein